MISIQKSTTVPETLHGQRLDSALATLYPEYSRSQIAAWIKSGQVLKNDVSCKPRDKIAQGDRIEIEAVLTPEDRDFKTSLPESIDLDIVFEDDCILVINKPAGLVVHPGAGNKTHTLVNALLHHEPLQALLPRAGIIHRLDKDTTGLLVVAKTLEAHTSLIRQMQARTIEREYLALVAGYVTGSGTLETGFGRHGVNRQKMTVSSQGKLAVTHYAVNRRYRDFTLLDVRLMTGRTHQIRVHMQYIGHPVLGDQLYGKTPKLSRDLSDALKKSVHNMKRQALHAFTLSLEHPNTHQWMTFKAPPPSDFADLLALLENESE